MNGLIAIFFSVAGVFGLTAIVVPNAGRLRFYLPTILLGAVIAGLLLGLVSLGTGAVRCEVIP